MKTTIRLTHEDLKRAMSLVDALMDKLDDGLIEITVDASSGIGSIGTIKIPVKVNHLQGHFEYELWGEDTW